MIWLGSMCMFHFCSILPLWVKAAFGLFPPEFIQADLHLLDDDVICSSVLPNQICSIGHLFYHTPHWRVTGARMMEVDSINPAGDSRVSHHYASLNDKAYRENTLPSSFGSEKLTGSADYLLGVPTGGSFKATIFLVCVKSLLWCDYNSGELTSSWSFMAGRIFLWAGETKSRCCWKWASALFARISWALVGR